MNHSVNIKDKGKRMKKTYIIPVVNIVHVESQGNLMITSLKIDSSKSGGDALVKGSGDWDIWGGDAELDGEAGSSIFEE